MADKKRGIIAKALGVGKKKPLVLKKRTITGGYSPDRRSQGQKHGEAAKKRKLQKKVQDRHQSLLTNDGKGTPRPKVKTAMPAKTYGPKQGPASKIKTKSITDQGSGVKKPKARTLGLKAKGAQKIKTDGPKAEVKKAGLKFKQTGKAKRQAAKAKKLSAKADAGAKDGSITKKKYDRLNKRAVRKLERSKGTRRSAAGTALHKVGRAAFGVTAAAGGSDAAIRKAGTKGAFFKRAAHMKKKK